MTTPKVVILQKGELNDLIDRKIKKDLDKRIADITSKEPETKSVEIEKEKEFTDLFETEVISENETTKIHTIKLL
jgi:hypothetical protein